MPPGYMLEVGKSAADYFDKRRSESGRIEYRLKNRHQYAKEHKVEEPPSKRFMEPQPLTETITSYPMSQKGLTQAEIDKGTHFGYADSGILNIAIEIYNRVVFADFCEGLLQLNPIERWSPQQARQHPYITGEQFHPSPRLSPLKHRHLKFMPSPLTTRKPPDISVPINSKDEMPAQLQDIASPVKRPSGVAGVPSVPDDHVSPMRKAKLTDDVRSTPTLGSLGRRHSETSGIYFGDKQRNALEKAHLDTQTRLGVPNHKPTAQDLSKDVHNGILYDPSTLLHNTSSEFFETDYDVAAESSSSLAPIQYEYDSNSDAVKRPYHLPSQPNQSKQQQAAEEDFITKKGRSQSIANLSYFSSQKNDTSQHYLHTKQDINPYTTANTFYNQQTFSQKHSSISFGHGDPGSPHPPNTMLDLPLQHDSLLSGYQPPPSASQTLAVPSNTSTLNHQAQSLSHTRPPAFQTLAQPPTKSGSHRLKSSASSSHLSSNSLPPPWYKKVSTSHPDSVHTSPPGTLTTRSEPSLFSEGISQPLIMKHPSPPNPRNPPIKKTLAKDHSPRSANSPKQ